ncbi:MAG: hypothetical protein IJU36_08760 [Paludibacteraceae bacterium]|nr:hypothetical protein [Paludibacteraceae bacterium]
MRHETYIDVLKSVFLTVVCLVFFPLLLPAISPSQDPIGAPENLLIFGEEEEEQSASIHNVDSLSDASSDDWYVPAEIPIELRAPMRASAAACMTDSVLTFDIDSVLTEATTYDYDAAGRTIRTTVWQYNADGSRTGKSKQEYAFDANGTQIYTGTFAWDAATNDWKGTAKSEYVYNEAHKMESNITYTWVNNTWLPSQALTYAYDAAGREIEFTTYARNASLNRLVPSKQRLQTWYNASKKTLEINYTAYTNGAWSAGNKKEYDYDAKGNQIEYTYYASYSGGNWVGSTHELWTYNAANKKTNYEKQTWSNGAWANSSKEVWEFNSANRQTLHEKYSGSGTNWTISLREISGYDAAGNNTLVENYSLTSNVWKGTKKEEYTFNSAKKKIETIKYKWSNSEWSFNSKTVNDYDAAGNTTLSATYLWQNEMWTGSGTRTLKTFDSAKNVIEQISQSWSATNLDWQNSTRQAATYLGGVLIQEASYTWLNNDWSIASRKDYHYDSFGRNDTTTTYTIDGTNLIYAARTVKCFDSRGNNTLTHNASWNGTTWVMTTMSRLDVAYDAAGHKTLNATYRASADSVWICQQKQEWEYDAAGHEVLKIEYIGSNTDWVYTTKYLAEYNSSNKMLWNERYNWNNGSWEGTQRYEYNYDDAGRQTVYAIYLQWNASTQTWIGLSRSETIYDGLGRQIGYITANWSNGGWLFMYKYTYDYDNANNEIFSLTESYNSTSSVWENAYKTERTYTGTTLLEQSDYRWINDNWWLTQYQSNDYDVSDNKLRQTIVSTWNMGVAQTYKRTNYFYSCDAPTVNNGSQPRTPTELEEIDENNANNENNAQPFDPTQPVYNLQGQSVDPATYRGVVIQNGKKYILR